MFSLTELATGAVQNFRHFKNWAQEAFWETYLGVFCLYCLGDYEEPRPRPDMALLPDTRTTIRGIQPIPHAIQDPNQIAIRRRVVVSVREDGHTEVLNSFGVNATLPTVPSGADGDGSN